MRRRISVNLELCNKERQDGRCLVMIRLSENRLHARFSTGIAVESENFSPDKKKQIYLTESEDQYNLKNQRLGLYLVKSKTKLRHYLTLNPLLRLTELKTLLVGEIIGRNLLPDLISVMNAAYKRNESLTYKSCTFLLSYIKKMFIGIDFRYELLSNENMLKIITIMKEDGVNQSIVRESEMILNRMKLKVYILE